MLLYYIAAMALEQISKINQAVPNGYVDKLSEENLKHLHFADDALKFSFQQLRQYSEWLVDTQMWGHSDFGGQLSILLGDLGYTQESFKDKDSLNAIPNRKQFSQKIFNGLRNKYQELLTVTRNYPEIPKPELPVKKVFKDKEIKGQIFKLCPAAADSMVCCSLKVLNLVDNCSMACSYCVLQSHYHGGEVKIPVNVEEKLQEVQLDPDKKYRIGTGEYSDSLVWGNKNGLLEALMKFAAKHPNIILELKTKSANIKWLLENEVPKNVCCSWSLNPHEVVANEEHRTATVESRIQAAKKVAEKGIHVGFHIHPMMYFEGCEASYQNLIQSLIEQFDPKQVLWATLGCVTLLPELRKEVRLNYKNSKLLQMEMEKTPDEKLTYTFPIREKLYNNALEALSPWEGKVFQYLCMEDRKMWEAVMGLAYPTMDDLDEAINASAFEKVYAKS